MPLHNPDGQRQTQAHTVTKAIKRAAGLWGLSNKQLGRILGLSEATISRLLRDKGQPLKYDSKHWQLGLLFLRVFRGLDAYMGGNVENEKQWINANNAVLNGIPIELMETIEGLASTVQYIDCVRGHS